MFPMRDVLHVPGCSGDSHTSPVVAHLPFADHVYRLDATQNDPRTTEILEALYRARDSLDRAMVLLDNVVEVFALSDHDLVPSFLL
jgi:hypothetical protein